MGKWIDNLGPSIGDVVDTLPDNVGLIVMWSIGGAAVIVTLLVWLVICISHLSVRRSPYGNKVKRLTLVVATSLPIYVITAYLSIIAFRAESVFVLVRSIYQGFVLNAFLWIIIRLAGGWKETLAQLPIPVLKKYYASSPFCILWCCCGKTPFTRRHLYLTKYGALQLAVVRPVLSAVALLMVFLGFYTPGEIKESSLYLYLNIVNIVSLMVCMWSLQMGKDGLANIQALKDKRLVWKLGIVQLMVVLENIQALVISIIFKAAGNPDDGIFLDDTSEIGWADFILTVEIPIFALIMLYAYPASDSKYYKDVVANAKYGYSPLNNNDSINDTPLA